MNDQEYLQSLRSIPCPFGDIIVRTPWQRVADAQSVNSKVTKDIVAVFEQVEKGFGQRSVLVRGVAGSGKTHTINRLRRKLAESAFFVFITKLGGAQKMYGHVLSQLVLSLRHSVEGEEHLPLDMLFAGFLSDSVVSALEGKEGSMKERLTVSSLKSSPMKVFSFFQNSNSSVDRVTRHILLGSPEIDRQLKAAAIAYANPEQRPAVIDWLQGEQLDEEELRNLGLRRSIHEEDSAERALRSLGAMAKGRRPLVFVFDQIEHLMDASAQRAFGPFGNLLSTMRNFVANQLCIVFTLPDYWDTAVRPTLLGSERDRLEEYKFEVQAIRGDEAVELVQAWMRESLHAAGIESREGTYPIPEALIKETAEKLRHAREVVKMAREFWTLFADGKNPEETEREIRVRLGLLPKEVVAVESKKLPIIDGKKWLLRELQTRADYLKESPPQVGADKEELKRAFALALNVSAVSKELPYEIEVLKTNRDIYRIDICFSQKIDEQLTRRVGLTICDILNGHQFCHYPKSLQCYLDQGLLERTYIIRDNRRVPLPKSWKRSIEALKVLEKEGRGQMFAMSIASLARIMALRVFEKDLKTGDVELPPAIPSKFDGWWKVLGETDWIEETPLLRKIFKKVSGEEQKTIIKIDGSKKPSGEWKKALTEYVKEKMLVGLQQAQRDVPALKQFELEDLASKIEEELNDVLMVIGQAEKALLALRPKKFELPEGKDAPKKLSVKSSAPKGAKLPKQPLKKQRARVAQPGISSPKKSFENNVSVTSLRVARCCQRLFWLAQREGKNATFCLLHGQTTQGKLFHQMTAKLFSVLLSAGSKLLAEADTVTDYQRRIKEVLFCEIFLQQVLTDERGLSVPPDGVMHLWMALQSLCGLLGELLFKSLAHVPEGEAIERSLLASEMELSDDGGKFVSVRGRLDSVVYDHERRQPVVLEYKVKPDDEPAADVYQVALYHWLLKSVHGIDAEPTVLYFDPVMKPARLTKGELQALLAEDPRELASRLLAFEPGCGATLPGANNPLLCQRCPHLEACKESFGPWENHPGVDDGGAEVEAEKKRAPVAQVAAQAFGRMTRVDTGVVLGYAADDSPICWKPLDTDRPPTNSHMLIVGTTGSGKTQAIKAVLKDLCRLGIPPLILDYKDDYATDYAEQLGYAVYDVATSSLPFNPLSLPLDRHTGNINPMTQLSALCNMIGRVLGLGVQQKNHLRTALRDAYYAAGYESLKPHLPPEGVGPPAFRDVCRLLEQMEKTDTLLGRLAEVRDLEIFPMEAGIEERFAKLLAKPCVMRLSQLPSDETKTLVAQFVALALYGELIKREQPHKLKHMLVIDEAWRLAKASELEPLYREGRALGLGMLLATQGLDELPAAVQQNMATKIFLRVTDADQAQQMAKKLTGKRRSAVLEPVVEKILNMQTFEGFISSDEYKPYAEFRVWPYHERD